MDSSGRSSTAGAVILAGGLSRRMGFPKALLRHKGATWLETIALAYCDAGIPEVMAITHSQVAEHPDFPRELQCGLLVLDQPTPGPLQTLWQAMDHLPESWTCFFMHPVDHPFVKADTISSMRHAYHAGKALIVQPCFKNRGGHPVLLDRSLDKEIRSASEERGLRQVIRHDRARVLRLDLDDEGILKGINCPEDL